MNARSFLLVLLIALFEQTNVCLTEPECFRYGGIGESTTHRRPSQ